MGCSSSKPSYETQDSGVHELANADDAHKSEALKAEALRTADEMFEATKGRRFHENYTRLTLTSYGASCKVLTAYHRVTNKKVAVKTIPKSRKQLEKQRAKVKLEIGTFRLVEDHPNAVRVLEVFEGAECYYICMECCEGGELFDHISKKQASFTERQAAHLLRGLMLFLAHMHGKGIAHLDIKPENIMFDSEGANGVLKVLDFGSSAFVQPNETVRNAFGTVRYASPEMANDVCGQKADIWSVGVVMYILLSGRAPFLKSNDVDTLNLIKSGPRVKFAGERWAGISQAAKDCIKALLEPNPRLRPSAVTVLNMPWLKQQAPETIIVPDTLRHLRAFANQSRIRRLLLGLMADQLVGSGANQLLGQFYTLDKDFSGTLEVSELVKAAKEAIPDLSEHEINRMFEALDVDRTGTVDIKEFFAGLIQTIDEEKQTLVAQKSFTMLDKRGAGFVTKEAFMEVLLERAQAGTLKTLAPKAEQTGRPGPQSMDGSVASSHAPVTHGRTSGADGGEARVLLDPGLVSELEQEFANLDANGDGVLSFEEFKAILGIQSTPEGLQLTQPQLPAAPSIAENMETLAQTLRTRTRSHSALDEARATSGSNTRTSLRGAHRHSNSGGPSSTGALGPGAGGASATSAQRRHSSTSRDAPQGRSSASGTPLPGGIASATSQSGGGAKRRSHTGSSGLRLGGGGGMSPMMHVAGLQEGEEGEEGEEVGGGLPVAVLSGIAGMDRAAIDLEQPLDMETRDLLQLLAPAKRTPSSAAYGTTRGASGGLGGGGGEPGSARTPSVRDIHSQTVAALLQRAASINASHGASMTAASVAALNKQPSVRNHASGGGGGNGAAAGHAPHLGSLPPLPSGASYHEGGSRGGPQHGLPPHGHGQHRAPAVFDPFGDCSAPSNGSYGPSGAPGARAGAYYSAGGRGSAAGSGDEAAGGAHGRGRAAGGGGGTAGAALAPGEDPVEPGGGGGTGYAVGSRELLLYAVPLFKDRLVFLPVVTWKDEEDTSTVMGKVNAGLNGVQQSISGMWHSLKDKGNLPAKIYKAGQAILENMNAEERLMRNIPKRANKLVVHHPACVPPDEIQDQLTALTSTFCYKSAGKAAAAGVMLPVAVGLELIAVPGIGWYTAYQLFKSTSAAAGGSRLNNYLKSDKREVRICYSPEPKMDLYILKARLSPDGVLGGEDIEDFCHDLREPQLLHPLTELRNRHLKKTQTMNADYALLPMNAPDGEDPYSASGGGAAAGGKKKD